MMVLTFALAIANPKPKMLLLETEDNDGEGIKGEPGLDNDKDDALSMNRVAEPITRCCQDPQAGGMGPCRQDCGKKEVEDILKAHNDEIKRKREIKERQAELPLA